MNNVQDIPQSKKILVLKEVDITLQLLLITMAIIYIFLEQRAFYFLIGYFVVGGWQLTSYVVHLFFRNRFIASPERSWYGIMTFALIAVALVMLLLFATTNEMQDYILFFLVMLLFIAPFYALKYLLICIREVRLLKTSLKKIR